MNIIVHEPKGETGLADLKKCVAAMHAEAVLQFVEALPCSREQKLLLLEAVLANAYHEAAAG